MFRRQNENLSCSGLMQIWKLPYMFILYPKITLNVFIQNQYRESLVLLIPRTLNLFVREVC